MTWSLFEHTHPRNIFVFGRSGVEHTPYNTYVIIANDYNMAKRILENICGYFAPWIENGTLYTRMCNSWSLQSYEDKKYCRKHYMQNALDYYTFKDMEG